MSPSLNNYGVLKSSHIGLSLSSCTTAMQEVCHSHRSIVGVRNVRLPPIERWVPSSVSPEKTAVNFETISFLGTSYSTPRIARITPAVNMFARRGAKALCQSARCFSSTATQQADFTHAVIGGGAVGLAIARRLQQRDGVSTVLIEKHGMVGSETSSRNSEVIHRICGLWSILEVY
jgi:hypothetical protein